MDISICKGTRNRDIRWCYVVRNSSFWAGIPVLQIDPTSPNTPLMVYLSERGWKMVHRLPQRVTRVRKIFLTVVGQEEYHLGRKCVIRQNIPPSSGNPLVSWYFGFWKWAMVKVLGLDNSEWKDVPYYPYIWCLMIIGNNKFILEYLKG